MTRVAVAPPRETLERLRAQTERLLDESSLCPNGGRVVAKQKIGGLSSRSVVHWVETGEYPLRLGERVCKREWCVDCGRPGFDIPEDPEPAPIEAEPAPVVPAPPPVPAPPVGVAVEPVAAGAYPDRDRGSGSSLVPVPVPARPVWVPAAVSTGRRLAVLVVAFVCVVVLVQGVRLVVSRLPEVADVVEVQVESDTPVNGE